MIIKSARLSAAVFILFLCVALFLCSCQETTLPVTHEEKMNTQETQKNSVYDADATDDGEVFAFPGDFLCLFHGANHWGEEGHDNHKILPGAEDTDTNSCMRLLMMRIAKDEEAYRTYRDTLVDVYPAADISGFPDIPEAWFQENSLLTLFIVDDIVGEGIQITEKVDTRSGYYLFCETDKTHKLASGTPDYTCGTLLVPVTKEQSAGWKDIGLFLYSKHEVLQEAVEERKTALKTKYSHSVETAYKEAVYMQSKEGESEEAWLTMREDDQLISDGLHDDVFFPVRIRLKNEALLFPEEASKLVAFGELMCFRNAIYEDFATKYQLKWIEGDPLSDYSKVEDLSCTIPEWQLFLLVTVPELNEILNDDRVSLVDFPSGCNPVIW